MPTKFDTRLAAIRNDTPKSSTLKELNELQDAFKRLGRASQEDHLKELRSAASNDESLDDLADLLENVMKPETSGSRPRRRPTRRNDSYNPYD